jgi:hypothetical protein
MGAPIGIRVEQPDVDTLGGKAHSDEGLADSPFTAGDGDYWHDLPIEP